MLTEIRNPRQIAGEPRRRWFHSPEADLIVWYDAGGDSLPTGFQFCYDKAGAEKALSWKADSGLTHTAVDNGERASGSHKGSPLLTDAVVFDGSKVLRHFDAAAQTLPESLRAFVLEKLSLVAGGGAIPPAVDYLPMECLPAMSSDMPTDSAALDADELMNLAARVDQLPPADAEWVGRLMQELMRSRMHEADLLSALQQSASAEGADPAFEREFAQIALDTADWLKTLWNVGYMGAGSFPSQPRSSFPSVELDDVLKSSLFSRIRQGKRPLPFPPPTRHGSPWHELVESSGEAHTVDAEIIRDESGALLAASIEACSDWRIVEEFARDREYLVQHQGKGPFYRLTLGAFTAELQREPPRWTRYIREQERGGFSTYTLLWSGEAGLPQEVPLRATTWARAESEADHWIAGKHPEMYGQVSFARSE